MYKSMLRIENLSKSYGSKQALSNVSISVKKGSIHGLIGQNGAGKTSLIRILNQIIESDAGTIYFEDKPLSTLHNLTLGYLPEERGLYKNMSIEEQALYFGQLKGMSKVEAKEALEDWLCRFKILDWKKKKIQDLSKGMAQKVQFIVTVLHNPKLLILDEPFSGFDPVNAQHIAKEIQRLAREGTTILFSSHRMESVAYMCDSLSLLHQGKVVLAGEIDALQKKYAQEVFEVEIKNPDTNLLNAFLKNSSYQVISVLEDFIVKLEVLLVGDNCNLLAEVLAIGEVVLYKQSIPSLEEIFIKTIANV